MDNEPEVFEAELVVPTQDPAPFQDVNGKFLPGHKSGRPLAAKGKVSHALLESFSTYISEHPEESPVIVLINLSMGRATDPKTGEAIPVPVSVRCSAASRLMASFLPPSQSVHFGDIVKINPQAVAVIDRLRADPGIRGHMERAARQIAAATVPASDSHILALRKASLEPEEL